MRDMDVLQEQMAIAERLQALRTAKGFKQTDMAEILGMSYYTYVKLENASHGITTRNLVKICRALNVTADLILFGNTGEDNINFDEYISCARNFSDDGLTSIEGSLDLIRKLRKTAGAERASA